MRSLRRWRGQRLGLFGAARRRRDPGARRGGDAHAQHPYADPDARRTPAVARASASPSRASPRLARSAVGRQLRQPLSEADVAAVADVGWSRVVSHADLPGIEGLLLDHVSLSTPQGGSVMDSAEAAAWLRDHAGPASKSTASTRGTQDAVLQVVTDGWPNKDPIEHGQVTFSLRRYDANGRPDEDSGDWKIDVIEAE